MCAVPGAELHVQPTGDLGLQITNLVGTGARPVAGRPKALKAKRTEEERLRREREEQARRWREEEERRWEERRRLERLTKEAVSWREARLLRDFAEAALRQLGSAADDDEPRGARRAVRSASTG